MALRKEKLERFRKELSTRRERLATQLSHATADFINDDEVFADSVDQAAADVDRSFNVALKNRERVELGQIEEALRRIQAGTYGACTRCGEAIAESRIKAFPFTTFCIDCKAELESEEGRFPGRH